LKRHSKKRFRKGIRGIEETTKMAAKKRKNHLKSQTAWGTRKPRWRQPGDLRRTSYSPVNGNWS
jgi:hypothetical protein